jgi:hypothetical protein
MMYSYCRNRLRTYEQLESRTMFAGDVTVQLINGDVIITGDLADNSIRIASATVHGQNDANGAATNINGVANGSFNFSAYTRDLVIRLQDGDDVVQSTSISQVPRDLVIDVGSGFDLIDLSSQHARVARDIVLWSGSESDRILLNSSTPGDHSPINLGGSLIIDAGTGNDEVRVSQIAGGANATIDLGFDADLCVMTSGFFGNVMQINGWAGYDSITADNSFARIGSLNGNEGIATIVVRNCRFDEVLVMTSTGGNDFLWLDTTLVEGILVFASDSGLPGDAGSDYLRMNDSRVEELQSVSGAGSDRLEIERCTLFNLYAILGDDPDWLLLTNVAVDNDAQANGGEGFDRLTLRGNRFNRLAINSFEFID